MDQGSLNSMVSLTRHLIIRVYATVTTDAILAISNCYTLYYWMTRLFQIVPRGRGLYS